MRMSDWSSDVCSSDLPGERGAAGADRRLQLRQQQVQPRHPGAAPAGVELQAVPVRGRVRARLQPGLDRARRAGRVPHAQRQGLAASERQRQLRRPDAPARGRSEEHTSELQSLMRNSYAVFCLKKTTTKHTILNLQQSNTKQK